MKNLTILGSTGSIGKNTLNIVEMFPDRFSVKVLAARDNINLLAKQIEKFQPEIAVVINENLLSELKRMIPSSGVEILCGHEGYKIAATCDSVDMVVSSMVGAAGLMPTIEAIEAGKKIALANKETLVMAGEIVMQLAVDKGVEIIPIDSEHSAIFQCLAGQRPEDFDKILLTASGGPFLNRAKEDFDGITPADALNHPNWDMGNKISIDSATLDGIQPKGPIEITPETLCKISCKADPTVIIASPANSGFIKCSELLMIFFISGTWL